MKLEARGVEHRIEHGIGAHAPVGHVGGTGKGGAIHRRGSQGRRADHGHSETISIKPKFGGVVVWASRRVSPRGERHLKGLERPPGPS